MINFWPALTDRDRSQDASKPQSNEGGDTLSLSVFILLLSFFIVLNSLSNRNTDKERLAMDSINLSFATAGDIGASNVLSPDAGKESRQGDAETAAAEGLAAELPNLGFGDLKSEDDGRIMTVRLPFATFNETWPDVRTRITTLLLKHNPGQIYGVDIIALDGYETAMSLAGYAADLSDAGVPAKLIRVGFEARNVAAIELRFQVRNMPQGVPAP